MSMLTAQVDELRTASTWVSLYLAGATNAIPMNTAILLRDAADTIEGLRNRLTETCHDVGFAPYLFECSECGKTHLRNAAYVDMPNYCPECGAKVVI